MEEIIKIKMGTCACHDKEKEKPRRMKKLKSSKLKKELQATDCFGRSLTSFSSNSTKTRTATWTLFRYRIW